MKKILVLASVLLSLSVSSVFAEEDDSLNSNLKDRIRVRIENVREEVKERKLEQKEIREENREQRSANHADRLTKRFGMYYERLNKIILKIQERIDNLDDQGKNMALSQEKLNLAKGMLAEAKENGDQAINLFNSIEADSYELQRETALKARDLAKQATKAYIDSHKLVKETVKIVKSVK